MTDLIPAEPTPAAPVETSQAPITPESEPAESQQQPQYVTKDDLQKFGDDLAEAVVKRTKQSTSDQIKAVNARLAQYDQFAQFQATTGAPIPADAQAKAKAAIREAALNQPEQVETPENAGTGMNREQWNSYIANQTQKAMQKAGVEVVPGDPEWNGVIKSFQEETDLANHLLTVADAARVKKDRLASAKKTAAARTGGASGQSISPGDISNITDPAKLYEMGEQELQKRK